MNERIAKDWLAMANSMSALASGMNIEECEAVAEYINSLEQRLEKLQQRFPVFIEMIKAVMIQNNTYTAEYDQKMIEWALALTAKIFEAKERL